MSANTLAQLEAELQARQDDLDTCNEMLALEPDSPDALETIPILEADIQDIKSKIAARKADHDAAPPPPPDIHAPPPPPPPQTDADEHLTVFNVKDVVMAKWSEDKQWYQATIVSKTGSSTDPVYKVTFKSYNNSETKRKHEVRAIPEPATNNGKKRKADLALSTPASLPTPKSVQTGSVISAAPSVDTTLVQKRQPSKVSDGPTRLAPEPKKLKGNKVLEKGKSNWQDFQKGGPKKGGFGGAKLGKDSQFRTPELPGARVGFTGSGKPMQKDQARKTWKYGGGGDGED